MSFFPVMLARVFAGALLPIALASAAPFAAPNGSPAAAAGQATTSIATTLAVRKDLGAPPAGVTELKFRDVYKMPVGPKGLEPTPKLLALDGKRVRIVGYMVQQESVPKGSFLLSPLPALISDEDESLADDLPASAIRIELPGAPALAVPPLTGLLQLTGTLRVGMRTDAATGRATPAQLVLDAADQRELQRLTQAAANAHASR
jgi:hypothetical protein